MAFKIISIKDEEMINEDYRCECGGAIIDGVQHPDGDYDDWIIKPHCQKCGKESWSNKRPYCDFIPIVHEPCTMGAYLVRGDRFEYVLPFDVDMPPKTEEPRWWGMGGTMWYGAEWTKLNETISRPEGISDEEWSKMVASFFEDVKNNLCQVCGKSKAEFQWHGTPMCMGCSVQTGNYY